MHLAVLSDLHANREALAACLAEADARGADAVVCLGDVVGYGPDPAACVALVRARCAAVVLGNHDAAVATGEGLDRLPPDGRRAAQLHRAQLGGDDRAWLAGLPPRATFGGCTLAHAAPAAPETWPRLDTFAAVRAQFDAFDTAVCFVGHSHRPAVVADQLGVHRVRRGHRYLVDVGSVGQPRDGDPRAAFGLFDTEAFAYRLVRVPYDVEATARRMAEEGLPEALAERLRRGR